MHLPTLLTLTLLPILTLSIDIILSNDDGWAEINIRTFYDTLLRANENVIISAPAENNSGKGSKDAGAKPLSKPCEFNSCPKGSPPEGNDNRDEHINYVNSYPVTSMKYGIQTLARQVFGTQAELAVAGPNVGSNLGPTVFFSGTVGAATEAAKEHIPAIAFSGSTGSQTSYMAKNPDPYVQIYADLATNITQTLIASGKPYLPENTWLNVNFPAVTSSACTDTKDFKFVLSRIFHALPVISMKDLSTCGGAARLPTEEKVVGTKGGCFVSVSVGKADTKTDAGADVQGIVRDKLGGILSCLPS